MCALALLILIGMGRDGSEASLPPLSETALLRSVNLSPRTSSLLSVLHGSFESSATDMFAHNQADGVTFLDEEHCCHDVC